MTLHLALWGGPNPATGALLRAFEQRSDTFVSDEPLYGHYLRQTGADHPDASALQDRLQTDWRQAIDGLDGPAPDESSVWVQNHMPHHFTFEVERGWLAGFEHLFLIQEPRAQIAWLLDRLGHVRFEDTGVPHLLEMFRWVRRTTGRTPLVITVEQLLAAPAETLQRACEALGLAYDASMLSWPPEAGLTRAPWAPSWYEIERGAFPASCAASARGEAELPAAYEAIAARCAPLHAELEAHKRELLLH